MPNIRFPRTALALVAAFATPPLAMAQDQLDASATLSDAEGALVGSVGFRQFPSGVMIEVNLTDLPPGVLAIHLHETGACSPDFSAAGDHFAPEGHGHGFAATETPHPGDLPNLVVGEEGVGAAHFLNQRTALTEGEHPLLDDDGAAVIVHAGTDNYGPNADVAGERIACGVIEPGSG
jgi:superoxide dismutase, Cu-Zn family